jgi:hypothetical protein
MQWVISKSLGLWRGYDQAECTGSFHTPWATPPPLGLVKIRQGDKQLMLFQPSCKWSFFYAVGYQQIAWPVAWL